MSRPRAAAVPAAAQWWWRASVPAAALLALCACPAPAPAFTSSTIALRSDGAHLVVTSPDDDALVELDATTLKETRRFAVAKGPAQVAIVPASSSRGEIAWATASLDTAIARVDLTTGNVVRFDVPCGGTDALAIANGDLLVACPNDDAVVVISDPAPSSSGHLDGASGPALANTVAVAGRPSALAFVDDTVYVATARGPARLVRATMRNGVLAVVDDVELAHDGAGPDASMAAVQSAAIAFVDGAPVVAYQTVDHDDRALAPADGGYGSVVDGAPRIEPRLSGPCPSHPAIFDGGARVLSGPSSLVVRSNGAAVLAGLFTDTALVLDCRKDAPSPWLATLRTGRGPRGMALAPDGKTLFVDAGFDLAVDRFDLDAVDAGAVVEPALAVARKLGHSRLSPAARRGQSTFFNAVDTHITPSGVVTCGTCHPAGGDDGLTWFLHTPNIPAKLRRTPPAWAARPALAPFHWDGAFATSTELAHATIVELLNGNALLVNLDDLAAYMAEAPPPPARPASNADDVSAGAALFADDAVGCASCHAGPLFADDAKHDVIAPNADDAANIADGLVDTPTLIGVRARAPYFHDGRAASLADVVAGDNGGAHGHTAQLTPAERAQLVAFLESL